MSIHVTYDKRRECFVCICSYENRDIPRSSGWIFNPVTKAWETSNKVKASRLKKYFDEDANRTFSQTSLAIQLPRSGRQIKHPKDQTLKEFQRRGVLFALERNHSYLAFDMGLGKTATSICVMNTLKAKTLIICPPFLVENWKRELGVWMSINPSDRAPKVVTDYEQIDAATTVAIISDTMIAKSEVVERIGKVSFQLLIIDEAHRFKNAESKRSEALYTHLTSNIERVVCLSGTPMPNRPMELFPVISSLAHNIIDYMDRHSFGLRYCGAYQSTFGWNYNGASNLTDLNQRLKPFMLRYKKEDVLPELGLKVERIVAISPNGDYRKAKHLESELTVKYGSLQAILDNEQEQDISSYRRRLGNLKVDAVTSYVQDILENTDETVMVMAWHKDTIALLSSLLTTDEVKPVVVQGETKMKLRDKLLKEVQAGVHRLLIAQIQTMVGYNLTRATRVVFAEYSWAPADNDQAMDRAHRIGQVNTVVADYMMLPGSLDEYILKRVLEKKKNINNILK